jgi:hypothetical protein
MEGSCACGTITYRAGEPLQVVNCHCNLCRNINDFAFSSYIVAKADAVDFSGSEEPQRYAATDRAWPPEIKMSARSRLAVTPSIVKMYPRPVSSR